MNGGKNDSATKECTRIVVGVIGVIFVVSSYLLSNFFIRSNNSFLHQAIAIFLLWLGVQVNYNPELNLLNIHKQAAYLCIIIGVTLFLTATLGWTAAATKNECLSFGVSLSFWEVASPFSDFCPFSWIVWLLGNDLLLGLHRARCEYLRREVAPARTAQ